MGLMDKVKAGVRAGAEQAALKVEEGMERLQTKRELAAAYNDLGRKTFELTERGEVSHTELEQLTDTIRQLRADLAADSAEAAAAVKEEPQSPPSEPTPSPSEPPTAVSSPDEPPPTT